MRNVLETGMGGPLAQYLPRETIIGNKIGYITDPFAGSDHHDASVINRDYVLTVMCNQIKHCINPFEGLDFDEVTEHWKKIKKTLDNYHQENDLPFYFTLFAEPHAHFKLGGSSGAMANISKVVHDVYYNGEVKL